MSDPNLGLPGNRSHRGVFLTGAGVLCATAVALSGCTGWTARQEQLADSEHIQRLEAEQARLARSERARKTAVRKLAAALRVSKSRDRQLRAANKEIADLETRLAKAGSPQSETREAQSCSQQSGQLAESLKAKEQELLAAKKAARKYRAELEAADKDVADLETRLAEATGKQADKEEAQGALKEARQQVESLKSRLDATSKERDALTGKLQESREKAEAAEKERDRVEQAAAKEAKTLRDELSAVKTQISTAEAKAASVDGGSAASNACSNR